MTNSINYKSRPAAKLHLRALSLAGAFALGALSGNAEPQPAPAEKCALAEWGDRKYAAGNWFGARDSLQDRGITFRADWRANFLAIVDGGLEQRGGFDQELRFEFLVDAAKLTKLESLDGLSFTGDVRWREGTYSINKYSGTDSTFRPSAYAGGAGWRFRKAYATYTTPELFGITEFLTLSGGWQVPTDLFLVQPKSKLFVNQTIRTAKGINPNLPWGGSFSTWGGYAKIEPNDWLYAQSGIYLAYPFGTDALNHGLSFRGYALDPSLNGLYSLNEIGMTPKMGPEQLPGKYASGLIYWGVEKTGFDGVPYDGNFQLYWQADQQLFREKSLATLKPKKDEQGLYWFSTLNFAPPENNLMQFYALGGLIYEGLIPGREKDQIGVAFAYGNYSFEAAQVDREKKRDPRTYQAVLEFDYRIQLNRFAYVQPVVQYIMNPGGRGLVVNDTILGLHMGVNF